MPFICPLCREGFRDKETLENHAMAVHGINAEGLQRLMMLMQGSHWLNNANKENNDEERDSGEWCANSRHRSSVERISIILRNLILIFCRQS